MSRTLRLAAALAVGAALTLAACGGGSTKASTGAGPTDDKACATVRSARTDREHIIAKMADGSMSLSDAVKARNDLAVRLTGAAEQATSPELSDALRTLAAGVAVTGDAPSTDTAKTAAATATTKRLCP